MSSVGIFAGIFDPIHNGHVELVKSSIEHLQLEEVVLLVEKKGWSKKSPVDIDHRREMVRLATQDIASISQMKFEEDKFTIEHTLEKVESKFSGRQLFFIFGGDVFLNMDFDTWPDLAKLLKHNIVVFERAHIDEGQISLHAKKLGIAVAILDSTFTHHSSTDVRLSLHEKSLWLPEAVYDYIKSHDLYN